MRARQVTIFAAILVGLVASVVASLVAGVEGCSTPTDECVRAMVSRLRAQAWLGVETEERGGTAVAVTAVVPGSPAEAAGFTVGDVLMTLDGVDLSGASSAEIARASARLRPGQEATCTVARAGVKVTLRAHPAPTPEDVVARLVGEHVITAHARVALPRR